MDLLVDKLNVGDIFTEKGIRLKVFTAENVKFKKGGGRGFACILAKIDEFTDPKNPRIHPLINGLYAITEDGRVNLGEASDYIPKK